jgi:hypothetical protein
LQDKFDSDETGIPRNSATITIRFGPQLTDGNIFCNIFEIFPKKSRIARYHNDKQPDTMKTRILQIGSPAIVANLLLTFGNVLHAQDVLAPAYRDESGDQIVQVGDPVSYSVNAAAGTSYQWLHNGSPMKTQTNSYLTINEAGIDDAGFYSCNLSMNATVKQTSEASLMVYTFTPDFDVVVYAFPVASPGNLGTCPGHYTGYVTYTKAPPTWGWAPTNTVHTASDNNRTTTKVEYVGDYGDEGCGKTTVTIPTPTVSPAYRFGIYFTNNVPTTNYAITLTGFSP